MNTSIRRFITSLVAALTAAFALPAAAGSGVRPNTNVRGALPFRTRASAGHLYAVAYPGEWAVDRFPLAADGLPAGQPDGVLYPQGLSNTVQGLGVDGKGNMFFVDGNAQTVDEFAAGLTGPQPPIQTLNLRGALPDFVRADRAGRLYVHYSTTGGIYIFAAGAHGNAKPISSIPSLGDDYLVADYLVSSAGVLYVIYFAHYVGVYLHPLDHPAKPDVVLLPQGGIWEREFWLYLALDEKTSRLYIQFGNLSTVKTYFAARYTWDLGGVKLDKWILSPRCYGAQQSWIAGAAIAGNYLAVSCQLDSDALVFRADRFGWRKPVETIGQGDAISGLVAVGP